ncbi:MAG TPA: aquaporin [Candidatus Bathyarchaeia archaeon]|nr:aquaporin [Candidatus Bathyarchaeia archaeon]
MRTQPGPRRELERRDRASPATVWVRRIAAEAVGTFALTFVAVGADAAGRLSGGEVGPAARAIAPALLIVAFIYALGDVSGAHFNPIVSLGFAIRRLFPVSWLVPYWLAQLGGAIAASIVLRLLFGDAIGAGVSEPHLVSPSAALAIETLLTWLLVTVILGTADRSRLVGPDAALAVGATIALCGLIAIPIEGASMNPARSIGPALLTGRLGDLWIYLAGPAAGSLLAVGMTRLLHGPAVGDEQAAEAAQGDQDADRAT